jgi:uncharacterized damage-inducible protein DinB
MKPEHVRLLYDYYTWANNRTFDVCAGLTEEQFTRGLGSSFPSVRDTLVHLLSSGWFWHERWQGRAPQRPDFSVQFKDVAGVREWANGIDRDLHHFAGRLRAADLESTLEYRTTEGEPAARQFWQMLQHVVNHGSYHRGQITTMLRQLGASTVAFDLIAYLREPGVNIPAIAPGLEKIKSLFQYNSWASRRTFDACGALSVQEFTRDLRSSFPSVRDTLVHLMLVEWIWLERWHGRSQSTYPSANDFPDLASVRARSAEFETNLTRFVLALTEEGLTRRVEYKNTKGIPYSSAMWEMMLHLVNHQTYHRGQVAALLRQMGHKPKAQDMAVFFGEYIGQAAH